MSEPGVFTLPQPARERTLLPALRELTEHHREHSPEYRRILAALDHRPGRAYRTLSELPWLPVGLFKRHTLRSVPAGEVFRVLTSSGTTGEVSRVYLDRAAAAAQQRALAAAMRTVVGRARLPMLLVESRAVLRGPGALPARAAGVLGMMGFGRDHAFVLDEREAPDPAAVAAFLHRHGGRPFLVFGFTFLVWSRLYDLARQHGWDLSHGLLIHSGGWKRLTDRAVDNREFRERFGADTGLRRIHNFYGMVEQMGTIFLEGPSGDGLYCPDFADVLIRDPVSWRVLPVGEPGVVQVLSTLPRSYPGHVLLTEDLGVVHGVDDGDWPGRRFSVLGRVPRTEPRGCSDSYPGRAR
ncbi:acyl-protein synthetase [Plantactinospora sp. CA-294935]|uniref:LuxE/PaaK family acyltransferase n=1 Tax=Plantactinospora sp. CA-294935 TaxID=3240012 RepID=UPI003D90C217